MVEHSHDSANFPLRSMGKREEAGGNGPAGEVLWGTAREPEPGPYCKAPPARRGRGPPKPPPLPQAAPSRPRHVL